MVRLWDHDMSTVLMMKLSRVCVLVILLLEILFGFCAVELRMIEHYSIRESSLRQLVMSVISGVRSSCQWEGGHGDGAATELVE